MFRFQYRVELDNGEEIGLLVWADTVSQAEHSLRRSMERRYQGVGYDAQLLGEG